MWYGWYSEKQNVLFGVAKYINKAGEEILVTEIGQDPNYKGTYPDSIYLGRITHFCGVQRRRHTKARANQASEYMYAPNRMIYQSGRAGEKYPILN